jgi:hypothetical protein
MRDRIQDVERVVTCRDACSQPFACAVACSAVRGSAFVVAVRRIFFCNVRMPYNLRNSGDIRRHSRRQARSPRTRTSGKRPLRDRDRDPKCAANSPLNRCRVRQLTARKRATSEAFAILPVVDGVPTRVRLTWAAPFRPGEVNGNPPRRRYDARCPRDRPGWLRRP